MKKVIIAISAVFLITACGPSAEEVKQKTINIAVTNVCDCYEANQGNWLAFQKCNLRIETGRILLEDDSESLAEYERQVKACNEQFKD